VYCHTLLISHPSDHSGTSKKENDVVVKEKTHFCAVEEMTTVLRSDFFVLRCLDMNNK
jgi:hypothetical protein